MNGYLQRKQVFNLWLSCYTQDEIATELGWVNEKGKPKQETVSDILTNFSEKGNIADFAEGNDSEADEKDDTFKLTKVQMADAEHAERMQ